MYRGRFAPTPSGEMHLGSLVAAVAGYLDAKAFQGEWLVRIEDIDRQRSKAKFESAILFELERHGLNWDGEIVRQSERTELYRAALESLAQRGLVYRCSCSRTRLSARGCPVNGEGEFIYDGFCRSRQPSSESSDAMFSAGVSLRFRVENFCVEFADRWQGKQKGCVADEVGDFILCRNDGSYSYNFVVVVDDFLQNVTQVVRGIDILPLTLRQILLQKELGYPVPRYGHVPLVMGTDGKKLSKSASARALKESSPLENLRSAVRHLGLSDEVLAAGSCGELLRHAIDCWRDTKLS